MNQIKRLKKALAVAREIIKGAEYVPRSKKWDEKVPGCPHPDHSGNCTREEIYYDASKLGTSGDCPFVRTFSPSEQREKELQIFRRIEELQKEEILARKELDRLKKTIDFLVLEIEHIHS
jgi:hypothetical protein